MNIISLALRTIGTAINYHTLSINSLLIRIAIDFRFAFSLEERKEVKFLMSWPILEA